MSSNSFSSIRREYGARDLLEKNILLDPIAQFKVWFEEILLEEIEPTAMTLATVDEEGMPDVRIVLLKDIHEENFIFYTDYDSAKGHEIAQNKRVALNFFWAKSSRQVRIRGIAQKVSENMSEEYFTSRPLSSQLSAIVSHQSSVISSREELEKEVAVLMDKKANIKRPQNWGGYAVLPQQIEFWQGRDNRLHDRILYRKNVNEFDKSWIIERLSP